MRPLELGLRPCYNADRNSHMYGDAAHQRPQMAATNVLIFGEKQPK